MAFSPVPIDVECIWEQCQATWIRIVYKLGWMHLCLFFEQSLNDTIWVHVTSILVVLLGDTSRQGCAATSFRIHKGPRFKNWRMALSPITIWVELIYGQHQTTWIETDCFINSFKSPLNSIDIYLQAYIKRCCILFGLSPWRYHSIKASIEFILISRKSSSHELVNGIQLYINWCWASLEAISSDIGRDRLSYKLLEAPSCFFQP